MGRRFLCLCLGEASSWVVVRGGGGDSRTLCVYPLLIYVGFLSNGKKSIL